MILCLMLMMTSVPAVSYAAFEEFREYKAEFEEYVIEQLMDEAKAIDISSHRISADAISQIYFDILYKHPQLFYVDRRLEYTHTNDKRVIIIEPAYLYTGQERRIMAEQYEMLIKDIAEYASAASTVIGQLMLVNDYFCVNFEFDTDDNIHDPYALLMEKKGVCEAYALAFGAVLNVLGIPNEYVLSKTMNHAWNMVQVDGEWYHIDVTWNDPVDDMPLRARHDNFLCSDEVMKENGYYGWETDIVAGNTQYDDAFWVDIKTPIPVFRDHLIYADTKPDKEGNRIIHAWNPATGETKDIGFSNIYGFDGNGKYNEGYSAIFTNGENLYYVSAESIFLLGEDGTSTLMYSNSDTSQMIWSAWVQNGDLLVLTGKDLKKDSKVKTLFWE